MTNICNNDYGNSRELTKFFSIRPESKKKRSARIYRAESGFSNLRNAAETRHIRINNPIAIFKGNDD